MKPEDLNPENDMEVRITALLLGELTAEEAAEVQAAIAQDPELMRLHDRLKVVLGLVKEAVPTTELPANAIPEPLTLADERREELLAVFKGGSPKAKEKKIIKVSFWQRYQKDLLKLAAMVMALLGMGWLMVGKREEESSFMAMLETAAQKDALEGGRDFKRMVTSNMELAPATPAPVVAFSASAAPPSHDFSGLTAEHVVAMTNGLFATSDQEVTFALNTTTVAPGVSAARGSSSFAFSEAKNRSLAEAGGNASYYASSAPENRAAIQSAKPAEPSINRGRVARGVTTLPSKAKAAAEFSPQAQSVGGDTVGIPLQTTVMQDSAAPMGNVQTRLYSIALPQAAGAEVAQVKELSDLTRNDAIQVESRMGRASKEGQVGGGGMGGGAKGNNWGYQAQQNEQMKARVAEEGAATKSSGLYQFGVGVTREIAAERLSRMDAEKDSRALAASVDKVDSWRRARQEYLPELLSKENAKGEALADENVAGGGRIYRDVNRNGRMEGMTLPTTPAQTASPANAAVALNFSSPTGAPAKPDVVVPGSMVIAGRATLDDVQKNVWYDNSGGIAGATVADPQWKGVLQNPTAGNQPQVGQADGLAVIPLESGGLKVGKTLTYSTDAPAAGKPGSGVAENAFINGGLRSNLGLEVNAIPRVTAGASAPATEFGTRAKAGQMGKDFDGDYLDGYSGEKLAKQQVDRLGASVADGRKLSESAPVVAVDLTPRVRMSLLEDVALPAPEEAVKQMSGVTTGLPGENKERVQELAKLQVPAPNASGKVEGWRPAREEYLSQLRAKDQVGAPLDKAQKEIDRLSDRRITLEREATYAKRLRGTTPDKPTSENEKRLKAAEAEIAQVDSQIEARMGELRKMTTEGGSKLLAAGEPVEVFVVEDESLNSVYKIQADGYVTLPKIGRVKVAGKDLPDAEKAIKEALEASPLARATVMVERADQMAMAKAEAKKAKEVDAAKKPAPVPPGIPQPEVSTVENAFSTFSLNVSDVSFKLAAASLEKGLMPELGTVRTEEFINAFNYHDPEPTGSSRVAFAWERARYPFAHDRDLVRFSVQTAAIGREPGKPLNIVLLLDNSGSMERADRIRIRQECLRVLGSQLQPQDKVSVVSFARTARLWVDGLAGAQANELPERVGNLTPEGGTNLEEAMNLAYQTAQRHFVPNGVNRVVLLTDGAANLGDVKPESLKKKVVSYRQQGVALDCFGIGWEGYNDDLLEALSRNGDGRYGFVNSPEAATTEFAAQLAGALKVAASDVKVQVEWNPKRVTVFRQLGYAKHQLKKEEFRDNKVDAAEIGAAEAGNALYTVQVNAAGEGPLGVVRVRYRVPGTDDYREQEWPLAYDGAAKDMQQATLPLRLAGTASAFSEWLVSSPYAGEVTPERLIAQMAGVPEAYPADPRPKQLEWMIRQAKSLSGR